MAKGHDKRSSGPSDSVADGVSETESNNGSVDVSKEDTCLRDVNEANQHPAGKSDSFPVGFTDFFRERAPAMEDGGCQYLKPHEFAILEVEEEDIDRVADLWGHCLLGCFAGRFPGLKAIRNLMETWKTECDILPHMSGWVIFMFQSKMEKKRILEGGPYFIFRRTLFLRSVPENFCFQEEDYSDVPTWVQLHNLPLQCWNTISKIPSKLAKPLCVDNVTLERKRIYYARVLVEIDTSIKPIEEFEVKLPFGLVYKQYVHFENLPKFCNHCYFIGHHKENCKFLVPPMLLQRRREKRM